MAVDRFPLRTAVCALRQARVALGPTADDAALKARVRATQSLKRGSAVYSKAARAQYARRFRTALEGPDARKYIETGDAKYLSRVKG